VKGFLCGPTYQTYSSQAASERTINLWPQTIEHGGKSKCVLMHSPGLRSFASLTDRPVRGLFEQDGLTFAVGGGTLYELASNGTATVLGSVQRSGSPVVVASNGGRGNQLMLVSNGRGYLYNTSTGVFAQITDAQFENSAISCAYIDGYFISVTTDRFQLSDLLNGTAWGADIGQRVGAADAIVGTMADHELLWLFGSLRTEVWHDSGAASFPFEPVPGVFMESGLGARYAVTRFGDSLGWLDQDERGGRRVMRNQGYNAVAISTAAIDAMLTALPTVEDMRAFAYQVLGHTFFVLTSPQNRLTLQYDAKEQQWSELAYWNTTTGQYEAHRAGCHAYAFGKHLVGDRETGDVYELTMDVYDDAGDMKRWLRRCPHLADEHKVITHHEIELDAEMGVGLASSSAQGHDPEVMLRYSDNGGKTWSVERRATLGKQGAFDHRARWQMLGSSRNRVYEFSGTDPVKTVLIDAYLNASVGAH